MRKHWRTILILVIVAAVGITGVLLYQRANAQRQVQSLQTAVVARGTLTASIGATGSVEARQQASLAFSISGRAGQVRVKMGDRVSAGQVLIEMDPAYYPQQVIAAKIDLVSAQKALDTLTTSRTSLAKAELDLANAKKALDDAQTVYDEAVKNHSQGWVEQAQDQVNKTYMDWMVFRFHNDGSRNAMIELQKRYQAYIAALQELEKAKQYSAQGIGVSGGDKASELALGIATAKRNLAQAQYDDALAEYNRVRNGVPAEDLRSAQARLDAAQATLNQVNITAPFAGTILSIDLLPGDIVTPGAAVLVIADLSELHVDVPIAEVDYNRLAVGQTAELVLDAIPDTVYHGQVEEINLNATSLAGSIAYPVKVIISDADRMVLPGMTVAVQIEVSHLEDVLLVPNRAVRTIDGSRVVYLSVNGGLKLVEIKLGASNDTMSEIVSGDLKEGDVIVLNPPSNFFGSSGGPMGGGGMQMNPFGQ
jgi:HlyD family secretion protein